MSNLATILWRSAERFPGAISLVGKQGAYSYPELVNQVTRTGKMLSERSIEPGDAVLYQISNSPAVTTLFFAILSRGAVAVPVNPQWTSREFQVARERCHAKLAISEREDVSPDLLATCIEDLVTGEDVVEDGPVAREDADTAAVFFSSGTTGRPKAISLAHQNLMSNAEGVATRSLPSHAWGPGTHTCAVLPLSHSFALTCNQNAALYAGSALSYLDRFDSGELLHQIRNLNVSVTALVPSAASQLLDAQVRAPGDVPLKYCLIGGAPISAALVDRFERAFDVTVVEGYGLTETSPVCAFRTPDTARKPNSVGVAAGHAELNVLDEAGRRVPSGTGELLVRGPGVCARYLDEEVATEDGWLKTGDLARIDLEGHVFIEGRLKDIIIRNGYNVSPVEVEQALEAHPGVDEAGVVGIADANVGEEIVAAVVVRSDAVTVEDLCGACVSALARYKQPDRILRVASIPKGAKGQVLRDALRAQILT